MYRTMTDEDAVGRAMFDELIAYSEEKSGDINIILLGGGGAEGYVSADERSDRPGRDR